jgi:hypothetical protein
MEATKNATFEIVCAMFEDVAERFKETSEKMKETDAIIKEVAALSKETDRQMKETDRQMKETDRKIGKLGNRLGDLIEELFMPNIAKKFNALGYVFNKAGRRVVYESSDGKFLAEVDILVEDGDYALAVEVKTNPTIDDVKDHIARMEKLRAHINDRNNNNETKDYRKYIGAIAGGVMPDNVRRFAQKSGFFVMEQTGETASISAVPKGWKPREW